MYVCICNPFTDCDVEDHLDSLGKPARMDSVYKACSGGEGMNCGSCACDLKKIVDEHNSRLAVGQLTKDLEKTVYKSKQLA